MAGQENVGSIVYEVDMELAPLIQGSQSANRAIGQLEGVADRAGKTFKGLDTQLTSTAKAVNDASNSSGRFKTSFQQAGYQIQDFIVQVQGGQSALVAFSQQGSQLAGAFGPGGAVLGAVIALGSVLAGVLMTALGSSSNKMKELQEAAEELNKVVVINSQGVAALSNDYARLAATNAALATQLRDAAVAKYAAEVENARKAISNIAEEQTSWWRSFSGGVASVTAAGNALDTLNIKTDNFRDAISQAEGAGTAFRSSTQTLLSTVDMMASKFDISEQSAFTLVKQLNDLAKNPTPDNVTRISQSLASMKSTTDEGRLALANFRDELAKAGASAAQAEQAVKDLEASIGRMRTEAQAANFDSLTKGLNQQLIALKQGKQAAVEYAIAQQDLTDEQKKEAVALSRQVAAAEADAEAKRKAEQAANRMAKSEDGVAQKLENLRQKAELSGQSTGELSRQQAILQAQQSLGNKATQEQINLAGQYAAKIWDQNNALKEQAQIKQGQKFAQQEITGAKTQIDPATGQAVDPLAKVNQEEQQKLAALAQYQALDTQNTQLYEDAKTAIQQQASNERIRIAQEEADNSAQAMSMLLGATSSSFDSLAQVIGEGAGKSSAAYKAMFVTAKAFAVAQGLLNLQTAIGNALALPWPANIPAVAAAAAAGGQVISAIGGISYGGGRKNGGPVSAGGLYQVGESGLPEIYQASNGRQYMIPGDNGSVISNKDLQGGASGGGVVINIQNYTNSTVDAQANDTGNGITVDVIVADLNQGGPISQAISSNHQAPRKARG
ncbi:phage tail protein [Mixta hanseatica]|uniref:Phage tail protein n=1 Tax=Mixta hanseatica TaxID=2872648 RepID=A0ABY4RE02_9GAMM|nr:phage tail protein [Mixta hanseatica]UQY45307.1 phage tail protein [Mixta hanseatica]